MFFNALPNKGIASDTWGNVSATRLRNTVSERRIVTPAKTSNWFLFVDKTMKLLNLVNYYFIAAKVMHNIIIIWLVLYDMIYIQYCIESSKFQCLESMLLTWKKKFIRKLLARLYTFPMCLMDHNKVYLKTNDNKWHFWLDKMKS